VAEITCGREANKSVNFRPTTAVKRMRRSNRSPVDDKRQPYNAGVDSLLRKERMSLDACTAATLRKHPVDHVPLQFQAVRSCRLMHQLKCPCHPLAAGDRADSVQDCGYCIRLHPWHRSSLFQRCMHYSGRDPSRAKVRYLKTVTRSLTPLKLRPYGAIQI